MFPLYFFLLSKRVIAIQWKSQSLNPVENLWHCLKTEVYKHHLNNLEQICQHE